MLAYVLSVLAVEIKLRFVNTTDLSMELQIWSLERNNRGSIYRIAFQHFLIFFFARPHNWCSKFLVCNKDSNTFVYWLLLLLQFHVFIYELQDLFIFHKIKKTEFYIVLQSLLLKMLLMEVCPFSGYVHSFLGNSKICFWIFLNCFPCLN